MPDDDDTPEERLLHEAEELMRQHRFLDAANRYQDARRRSPTDLWAGLGCVSALECAGEVSAAERLLDEIAARHRQSGALHRFRHLFFVRREDFRQAAHSQQALRTEVIEDGPDDQLADLYFNQGRYREAQAELERLTARDDDESASATVQARLGACLRQQGELEPARAHLQRAIAADPGNGWAQAELAEVERADGRIDEARRRYLAALEVNPDDHWTRGHLAQLEAEQGDRATAIRLYEEILERKDDATWALVELAQTVGEEDPARARQLLERALAGDPGYPWAHAGLGTLARRAGDLPAALAHLEQARAHASDAPWIVHEVADLLRHLGRAEEGLALLEEQRLRDPYEAVTLGYCADLLRHLDRRDEARAMLERAVQVDEGYVWAWRELAELKGLAGDHDGADACAQRALDLEPELAVNDGLRAFLLRCRAQREAMGPWLERAVARDPRYLWAWRELVELRLGAGDDEEAFASASRGVEAVPDAAVLHGLKAEAARRLGRLDEAKAAIERALQLAPEAAQIHAVLAEIHSARGDHAAAVAAVERAVAIDRSPELRTLGAQILIAAGRANEAGAAAAAIVAAGPGPVPAFEIAASWHERRGASGAAEAVIERGLDAHTDDPRLLVRLARLGVARGDQAAVARLSAALDRGGAPFPREAVGLFAQAGRGHDARRAAARLIEAAATPAERALGWHALGEAELHLGSPAAAEDAAQRAIACDPVSIPALVMAAVLADNRGAHAEALGYLRRLREQGEEAAVLRQFALTAERAGLPAEADEAWDAAERLAAERSAARLGEDFGEFAIIRLDRACLLARRDRRAEGRVWYDRAEAAAADAPERDRARRELALAAAREAGPAEALAELDRGGHPLGHGNRRLRAHLLLACDRPADAAEEAAHARTIEDDADERRALTLVEARARLAAGSPALAEALAAGLIEEAPGDEEAAVLAAEIRILRRTPAAALVLLTDVRLPAQPGPLRSALAACCELAEGRVSTATAWMARLAPGDDPPPFVRLVAAAFPGVVPDGLADGAQAESVPALPGLHLALSQALGRAGRHDLAGDVALAGAALAAGRRDHAREAACRRQAMRALIAGGDRRAALGLAWRTRDVVGFVRSLV